MDKHQQNILIGSLTGALNTDKLNVAQKVKAAKQIAVFGDGIEGLDSVTTAWAVREALEAAYLAGFEAAKTRSPFPKR